MNRFGVSLSLSFGVPAAVTAALTDVPTLIASKGRMVWSSEWKSIPNLSIPQKKARLILYLYNDVFIGTSSTLDPISIFNHLAHDPLLSSLRDTEKNIKQLAEAVQITLQEHVTIKIIRFSFYWPSSLSLIRFHNKFLITFNAIVRTKVNRFKVQNFWVTPKFGDEKWSSVFFILSPFEPLRF